MQASVIFTRHKLVPEQQEGLGLPLFDFSDLASLTIETKEHAGQIIDEIISRLTKHNIHNCKLYGVIPPILRHALLTYRRKQECVFSVYEALNINRALEGEKPSFQFKEWLWTGDY